MLLMNYGVLASFTTAYHPQANAVVERGHQDLKNVLVKLCTNEPANWLEILKFVEWASNNTLHS